MAEITLFRKAVRSPGAITFKDLFRDFRKKHTRADMEYAMAAGTLRDQQESVNRLEKWHRPWLFWRVFLIGLGLGALSLGLGLLSTLTMGGDLNSMMHLLIIPMIVPVAVMVFFWEMNIPRNISIYQLLLFFLVGTLLSFFMTAVMFQVFSSSSETVDTMFGAPLREEPAKLVAAALLMYWFGNKKGNRLCGLTGLVIGAAVGTGFSVFESIEYSLRNGIGTSLLRMVCAASGHMLYCAPYAAALGLHAEHGKLTGKAFASKDFLLTFGAALVNHALWNSPLLENDLLQLLLRIVIAVAATWTVALYMIRKCLHQAVLLYGGVPSGLTSFERRPGSYGAPLQIQDGGRVTIPIAMTVSAINGPLAGKQYQISPAGTLFGSTPECGVVVPSNTVSRRHCVLRATNRHGELTITDLGSTNGTFFANGQRLTPQVVYTVRSGQEFYLATPDCRFRVDT